MRLGRSRGEQPDPNDDPANTRADSELGWVKIDADLRCWIPCPMGFPDGMDRESWAAEMTAAWWEQSGQPFDDNVIDQLATMLRAIHEQGYKFVSCHQIWIYLPGPGTAPLPLFIGIWKQEGERDRRLRLLAGADDRTGARKPQVAKVTTDNLGSGLSVVRYVARDSGRLQAVLCYAFRVSEHETDLQVFTATTDLRALTTASDDIERFIQGITVYRNTDERRVAEP